MLKATVLVDEVPEEVKREVEATIKVHRPKPGDVLIVKVKSDDIDSALCRKIHDYVKKMVPGVGVGVLGVGTDDDVDSAILSPAELKILGRCPQCGCKGPFVGGAMTCPVHGTY